MLRIFLALLLLFAYTTDAQEAATIPEIKINAVLTFDRTLHDFGRVEQGPQLEHRFGFTSNGRHPLIITRCQTADPHVALWSQEPILPGKRGFITVTMPTQGRCCGTFRKTVTIVSNATGTNAPEGRDSTRALITITGFVLPDTAR